ncbi:hypothetical protein [Ideonella livida]|uniref:Uncharacterized protein n=1 Tax=Ideonella livida TaxID=2707176 RepID=A0A7C9THS5_9BURK|nr:hypothetical protein [Ideonella livida]NDY89723.1 hypothetical protein [Ideonella livida]
MNRITSSAILASLSVCLQGVAAQDLTLFKYAERGHVGDLVVLNEEAVGTPVVPIAISLRSGNQRTRHMCEFRAVELTGGRIQSASETAVVMQVVDSDLKPVKGEVFQATFTRAGAILSGKPNSYCGASAVFSGRWIREDVPEDAK